MPKRLLEHYQASLKDKELIALRDELALVDARLNDVLKRVDSGESGQLWWELRQTAKELDAAQAAKDMPAANILLADIRNLIERGAADYATWNEAMRLVEQRRKLSDSERRRVMDAQNVVTSEQAMLLVTVLSDSVRRHVSDKDALRAISEDINRYVLSNPVRESASSGDGA